MNVLLLTISESEPPDSIKVESFVHGVQFWMYGTHR